LQERLRQAGAYFAGKLDALVLQPMKAAPADTDNKAVKKSVQTALENAHAEAFAKLACLKVLATEGFVVGSVLAARAKATLEPMETKQAAARKAAAATAGPGHAGLYARLKAWRDAKAKEWEVPAFMILPLKTLEALVAQVPRTMAQLHTIKGLGKKKIEQMGSEILAVIEELEQQEELPAYSGGDEPGPKSKPSPQGLIPPARSASICSWGASRWPPLPSRGAWPYRPSKVTWRST
jgi:hypothetical protein